MILTGEHYKGLFAQLVAKCGGVEACAARLGISHQRVSQLQVLGNREYANPFQVDILQQWIGMAIVSDGMSALVQPTPDGPDPTAEAVEVVCAASDLLEVVHGGAGLKEVTAAVHRLKDEADDVPLAMRGAA